MFDGRAFRALHEYEIEMRYRIAERGKEMVLETLHEVLQNPTGYYESQVRVEGRANFVDVVTDGGVVYGPWLEGTSSRNQTTRFKGYGTFRKVKDRLEKESIRIAVRTLPKFLFRMN
jgi:hypothetical protein